MESFIVKQFNFDKNDQISSVLSGEQVWADVGKSLTRSPKLNWYLWRQTVAPEGQLSPNFRKLRRAIDLDAVRDAACTARRDEANLSLLSQDQGTDAHAPRLGISEADFLAVLEKQRPKLVNRVRRKCVSKDEAEDLVQNAVVWCLENPDKYDPSRGSVKNWVYWQVDSKVGHFNRDHINRARTVVPMGTITGTEADEDDPDSVATDDVGYDPTRDYELKISVQQALAKLPDVERAVAEAVMMEGATPDEYAAEANVPLRTVERRLARAKNKLKIHLQEWR